MKLFTSPTSPFVRKALIVIHELALEDRLELVPAATTPLARSAEVAAYNPLGKIPCLARNDGPAIFDSRVICRYLAALKPEAGLEILEGPGRWTMMTLEALGDGAMDAAVLSVYETRLRDESARSEAWVEGQITKVEAALEQLEARWLPSLSGPLDLGQITIACLLGYVDFRMPERDWRAKRPGLAKWHDKFAQRASYQKTAPAA